MASTDDSGSSNPGSQGLTDKIVGFATEPLGMGLIAGAVITIFVAWRMF